MDRSMNLRHLQLAERHVLRGSQNIFAQEQHIEALECRGWDATLARAVLQTFVITQTQFVAHRDQILEALGRAWNKDGFDVAVIDINVRGRSAYPIADMLMEQRIPFVFATGYGLDAFPGRFLEVKRFDDPRPGH